MLYGVHAPNRKIRNNPELDSGIARRAPVGSFGLPVATPTLKTTRTTELVLVPTPVTLLGEAACRATVEFFASHIRNPRTLALPVPGRPTPCLAGSAWVAKWSSTMSRKSESRMDRRPARMRHGEGDRDHGMSGAFRCASRWHNTRAETPARRQHVFLLMGQADLTW